MRIRDLELCQMALIDKDDLVDQATTPLRATNLNEGLVHTAIETREVHVTHATMIRFHTEVPIQAVQNRVLVTKRVDLPASSAKVGRVKHQTPIVIAIVIAPPIEERPRPNQIADLRPHDEASAPHKTHTLPMMDERNKSARFQNHSCLR